MLNGKGNKTHLGMTFIECLLAIIINLLIISIIFNFYLTYSQSHQLQMNLSHIQINATAAIDMLETEIHQAGFIGCERLTPDFPLIVSAHKELFADNRITGGEHDFSIWYAENQHAALMMEIENTSLLVASSNVHFAAGDTLLISDCKKAEIITVQAIQQVNHQQQIFLRQPLQSHFSPTAEIAKIQQIHFFTAKTTRTNPRGESVYALYMQDIKMRKEELVENIKSLTITYSIAMDDAVIDLSSADVKDWSKVVGVAIELEVVDYPITKNGPSMLVCTKLNLSQHGYTLIVVLVFMQLFSLLGITSLMHAKQLIKMQSDNLQKMTLFERMKTKLNILEATLPKECIQRESQLSELSYLCHDRDNEMLYAYSIENLGIDPCSVVEKDHNNQSFMAEFYRITLEVKSVKFPFSSLVAQTTLVKPVRSMKICEDTLHVVQQGRQSWREI